MAIDIAQHNFAAGQDVGIYLASTVSTQKVQENRSPDGAVVDTLTVEDDGTLIVDATGYDVGTYYAAAQVGLTSSTVVVNPTQVSVDGNTVPDPTDLAASPITIQVTATEIRESDDSTVVTSTDAVYFVDITAIVAQDDSALSIIDPGTVLSGDTAVVTSTRQRSPLDAGWDYVTFTVTADDV